MVYFPSLSFKKASSAFTEKYLFQVGNIFSLFFRTDYLNFFFEGICISIRKKSTPEFSFILRNIIGGTGVEICLSFYYNRTFFFKTSDFKKKIFKRKRSKLYYLKTKMGRESRVK